MAELRDHVLLGCIGLALSACGNDDELADMGQLATMSISALPYTPSNGFEVTDEITLPDRVFRVVSLPPTMSSTMLP